VKLVIFTMLLGALVGCGGALPDGSGDGGGDGGGAPLACGRTTANPNPSDAFVTAQWAIVGSWVGTAALPAGWTGASPYSVEITFHTDGTFLARIIDGSGQVPFYYDHDPDIGHYELIDVRASGGVDGDIYLDGGNTFGNLRTIHFDATQTHLQFNFFADTYGPIVYDLACDPQADATPWDMAPWPTPPPMDMAAPTSDLAF
jgi:hypothetical protein